MTGGRQQRARVLFWRTLWLRLRIRQADDPRFVFQCAAGVAVFIAAFVALLAAGGALAWLWAHAAGLIIIVAALFALDMVVSFIRRLVKGW